MASATGWYWQCPRCGTANAATTLTCRACDAAAPHSDVAVTTSAIAPPLVELQPNPPAAPQTARPSVQSDVRGRSYDLGRVDLTADAFATDAAIAQSNGWIATSQVWEGSRLTVVYQYEPAAAEGRRPTITSDRQLRITAGVVVVGGVIVALGALLPWLPRPDADAVAASGLLAGDGIIGLIIAAAVIVAGAGVRRRGRAWITALLASLLALGFGLFELAYVSARSTGPGAGAPAGVGIGIWVTLLGAVVAVLGSLASRPAR